jgi:GH18 family chitinase
MVSKCINQSGVVTDCGVSDQTSIICQQGSTPCNGFQVSSASYCGGTWEQPVSEPLNSATPNPQKKANDVQYNAYATFLTQVKLDLKTLTTSKHKPPELSIALAGAAWGLHWYASTVTHLLNTDVIDYANLMAYDFAGYWQTGERSGLLANYTNMDSLDECYGESNCVNKDCYDCLQTGCTSAGHKCGTYGSGAITCGWTGAGYQACSGTKDTPLCSSIPEYDKGCIGAQGVQFSNSNNILTPTSTDQACPLIEYNSLDVNANILATQKVKFNTQWWDDKQVVSNKVAGAGSGILTLSIEAMLNILTDTANGGFGVNPKKLVIGLPYYGRSFQSKTTPVNGTYGLFTKYDYGIPYSFSDIYYKNYKTNSGNVYTVNMKRDNTYTEDIVFAPESGIITKITDDITHEMISYGSVESTKYKVKAAKQGGYGGYMCWHMLSDYYEDMM